MTRFCQRKQRFYRVQLINIKQNYWETRLTIVCTKKCINFFQNQIFIYNYLQLIVCNPVCHCFRSSCLYQLNNYIKVKFSLDVSPNNNTKNSEYIYVDFSHIFFCYKSTGHHLPVVVKTDFQICKYPSQKVMLHEFTSDLSIAQGLCYSSSITKLCIICCFIHTHTYI